MEKTIKKTITIINEDHDNLVKKIITIEKTVHGIFILISKNDRGEDSSYKSSSIKLVENHEIEEIIKFLQEEL